MSTIRACSSSNPPTSLPLPNTTITLSDVLLFTVLPSPIPTSSILSSIKPYKDGPTINHTTYLQPITRQELYLFSTDDWLWYSPFCRDFGPFNICMAYEFGGFVRKFVQDPEFKGKPLCLVCGDDPDDRANAVCLIALFAVLEMQMHPMEVMQYLEAQELKPFRDACDHRSLWSLSIQDILYGARNAQKLGWIDLGKFSPVEYSYYEQVANGDLNILGPFVAFASPVDPNYNRHVATVDYDSDEDLVLVTGQSSVRSKKLDAKFQKVLDRFKIEGVKLVIRLNDKLYDSRAFTREGIDHLDMEFEDGSNPSMEYVREFITTVDKVISGGGKVAVHCKAGLGRTGALMGAYMIYKHRFSPGEAIGYMRLIRPGMVVGPQQVWLIENASMWTQWAGIDQYKKDTALVSPGSQSIKSIASKTPSRAGPKTPTRVARLANKLAPSTPTNPSIRTFFSSTKVVTAVSSTPTIKTPGQPRKTPGGLASPDKRTTAAVPQVGTPTPVKASKLHHPYNVLPTARKPRSDRTDDAPLVPPVPSLPKQYKRTKVEHAKSSPSRIPQATGTPKKLSSDRVLSPSKSMSAFAEDVFGFFGGGKRECQSIESMSPPRRR